MATALAEKNCTACRGGIPPLTPEEAKALRAQATDWALLDNAKRIERTYRFRNFREVFSFVERAALAEEEAHHPEIRFGWGFATISPANQENQGTSRKPLYHGGQAGSPSGTVSCWTIILAHLGRLVSFVPEWSKSN